MRNKKNRCKTTADKIKKLLAGLIFTFIICISGSAFLVSAHGISGTENNYTYYKSIEIQPGDTLWSIAETHMPDNCSSIPEYIRMIKKINRLETDKIQSGQHLIITYNDSDFK